ncbi:MAG TPA: fibronectin type III domain-containing protein, partial [Candidatus Thermoplasmatota archaeon]|nr:fibronectin type III domain-containing protein [Candidatus Thermoplasmatota archaeon]
MVLIFHRDSGKPIGSSVATLLAPSALPPFVANAPAIAGTLVVPSVVTVDGRTVANVSVNVTSSFGLAFVESVTVNLSRVGGPDLMALHDDGLAPDAVAGDGNYSGQFTVLDYAFAEKPATVSLGLPVRVTDILGHEVDGTATIQLASNPLSKVVQGAIYRDLPSSGAAAYLNLTNFTFRNPALLDDDEVEIRVSDLADPTKVWTALVEFGYSSCGNAASVTRITLTREGVSGSAVYTPAGGCFAIGPYAKLDLADLSLSTDNANASVSWSAPGAPSTYHYAAAGLSESNEGIVTFAGDATLNVPSQLGIGQSDLTWRTNAPVGTAAAPGAPASLTATAGNAQVSLSWPLPASDGGSPITGYRIYVGTTSGSLALLDTIGTNRSYVAAGLTNGQTYHFAVAAVNGAGEGARTPEASATPAATPSAPQGISATRGNQQVSLSWSAPASTGGSAITGYRIYVGTSSGALALLDTIGTNTSYVAAGLTNGVRYYFHVTAINGAGEGPATSEVSTIPATVPGGPQSLAATGGDGQVSLSWSAPASNGGSSVTGYKIYMGTSSNGETLLDTIGTNTSYVAAGLTNGQTYWFYVSAINTVGEGSLSNEASAAAAAVPSAPQSLSATRGNQQVSLSWSAPSSNGGSAITGYKIYVGTSTGSLSLLDAIGTNTSYVAAGLTNGQVYYFAIAAVNAQGEGARSAEASATPATLPGAPQSPAASAGNAQVSLSWSAPSSNGGSAITGYRIYRGTTSGSLALIDTIGTNTSYVSAG